MRRTILLEPPKAEGVSSLGQKARGESAKKPRSQEAEEAEEAEEELLEKVGIQKYLR